MFSNCLFPDSLEFSLQDALNEGELQNRVCKSLSLKSKHNDLSLFCFLFFFYFSFTRLSSLPLQRNKASVTFPT